MCIYNFKAQELKQSKRETDLATVEEEKRRLVLEEEALKRKKLQLEEELLKKSKKQPPPTEPQPQLTDEQPRKKVCVWNIYTVSFVIESLYGNTTPFSE